MNVVQVMEADHSQALILRPLALETPETASNSFDTDPQCRNEARSRRSMSGALDLPEIEASL